MMPHVAAMGEYRLFSEETQQVNSMSPLSCFGRATILALLSGLLAAQPTRAQVSDQSQKGLVEVRPVPDPTTLTSAQLFREIAALRAILETRLDGMDKALTLLQRLADKVPSEVDIKVNQLQALHGEKFRSIEAQFIANKVALDAALQATERSGLERERLNALAIDKSEKATTKQIDQIITLLQQSDKTMNDKILTLKERIDRFEGQASGAWLVWVILGGVVGIGGIIVGLVLRHPAAPRDGP